MSIASHRPGMPIVVVTSSNRVAQQLTLVYGCKTFVRPDANEIGSEIAIWLKEQGVFQSGDRVVNVLGRQPGLIGGTDTIKVRVLQ